LKPEKNKNKNKMENTNTLADRNSSCFIGWKSYKTLEKKTMEQEFSWSGFLISMAIVFFVVLIISFSFKAFYNSLSESKENNLFLNQRTFNLSENFNLKSFLGVKTVKAASEYSAEIVEWSEYVDLKADDKKELTLKIKNSGETTWEKDKVFFETGTFLRSFSQVKDSSWKKYYRPSALNKDIKPGETATIKFYIKAPDKINGMIQEYFQLVYDGKVVIPSSVLRLFITLESKDIAEDNIQVNREKSEIKEIEVKEEKNNLENEVVKSETKVSDSDFCIALSVSERELYENCRTDEDENDLTNGINENIKMNKEPVLRIGLFNTQRAERVKVNTHYDVYGGEKVILSGLTPDYVVAIGFNFDKKEYFASSLNFTKFSKEPIRIVPRGEGIVTLVDFDSRPKWNTSLNDNTFRNIIELRYSENTGKLWMINELLISDYLKGLAETSNYSPVDYQKAIVTAARTYAMYHYNRGIEYNIAYGSTKHGNEYFHLDATWDQVYRGYNSEIRLSKLSQAVDETKGAVITYNNDVVVTPYFSRSDGRTRSWEEVWYGGAKPWLKTVSVPEDEGQNLWGHGVGMSARGALIMIRDKGVDWIETLKHFYSNVEIEKIYK
jgi:hypothetical protein